MQHYPPHCFHNLLVHTNNLFRFANNASLGSGVRVRNGVRVREQRKVKRRPKGLTTKPLMTILDVTPQVGKNAQDLGVV